jgi:hypothetical protein
MKHALLAATMMAAAFGVSISANAQTAADLGKTLTPMGAVKAGNADGTIPAWTGGYTTPPAGWKPGDSRADPFASERPLFTITAQNVDKYQSKLADGIVAMIRTLPGYHVDVYPTHRTAAAPQFIYDNAIANASRASLTPNGEGVQGAKLSIPFPVPKNGNEAIWNHILRWRGTQIVRTVSNAITTPQGDYNLERWHEKILLAYNSPNVNNTGNWDSMFWQEVLAPPRIAGQLTLVISHEDPFTQPREAWTYNPSVASAAPRKSTTIRRCRTPMVSKPLTTTTCTTAPSTASTGRSSARRSFTFLIIPTSFRILSISIRTSC